MNLGRASDPTVVQRCYKKSFLKYHIYHLENFHKIISKWTVFKYFYKEQSKHVALEFVTLKLPDCAIIKDECGFILYANWLIFS